jgi:hypothetical protein
MQKKELINQSKLLKKRYFQVWDILSNFYGYPKFQSFIEKEKKFRAVKTKVIKRSFIEKILNKGEDIKVTLSVSWVGVEDVLEPIDDYIEKIKKQIEKKGF